MNDSVEILPSRGDALAGRTGCALESRIIDGEEVWLVELTGSSVEEMLPSIKAKDLRVIRHYE